MYRIKWLVLIMPLLYNKEIHKNGSENHMIRIKFTCTSLKSCSLHVIFKLYGGKKSSNFKISKQTM